MALKINSDLPVLRHYDKLIAVSVLVFLLVSLFYLTYAGAARKQEEADYIQKLDKLRPSATVLAPIDMADYEAATRLMRTPLQLKGPDPQQQGFLTPERRVSCVAIACQKPIPYAAEACPFCGAKQPTPPEFDVGLDSDGDKIPDKDEIRLGLNPQDPSDAKGDLDGDGFNNLEELLAKTDPKDPKSHPAVISHLRVKELRGKRLPVVFSGVNKMPDGKNQLVFNVTSPQVRTVWVQEGEPIGESGYTAGKVTIAFEEREHPNMPGIKTRVNVSTVVVNRRSDKKAVTLKINEKGKVTDMEAVLVLPLDKTEYTVIETGSFKVREETYRVVSIDSQNTTVTIENEANGQQKVVHKLD